MRLLKRSPGGEIDLRSFDDDNAPQYAILSHTWDTGQEVTYSELKTDVGKQKAGYTKIQFCIDQAARDGLEYSWVDTCCIDKSDNVELTTAINSMFRWYQRAAKCYVYLSDVQLPDEVADPGTYRVTWNEAFRRSRWFTRGWTLQELLAPPVVDFFSHDCRRLGSKILLEQEIHQITNIPLEALRGQRLSEFSVDERRKWVARRETTVKEDIVYCLLGICEVFLPLIYGEGEKYATLRLTDEIAKRQGGQESGSLQDLAVSSPLPFARNELFTGREDQLRHLEQTLLLPDTHRRMTIHGLGGCGKSALALEFAYRAMACLSRRQVFWVPAISQESFELAYREIGVCLRVSGITEDNADVKKLVKEALNSDTMQKWLMIVDNADDPHVLMRDAQSSARSTQLYDYLPYSDRGRILFTTRSRKFAGELTPSSVLDLGNISKAEATRLLERRLVKRALLNDQNSINKLLDLLTCLPLAIVQAAAFVNNNDVSLAEYISLFQESGSKAEIFSEPFKDPGRYREMDSTIARTWNISFSQIGKQDALAAEYLSFMACIDRINIPLTLLPPGDSILQQTKAIGMLKGYAFVTERQEVSQDPDNEKFFDMHRLVHMASAWWLDSQNERSTWATKAAARLQELIPYDGQERKEVAATYLPHAIHVARGGGGLEGMGIASLLDRVGRCQASLGQYSVAGTIHRQVLSLREKNLGKKHEQTLTSMNEVASALADQGRYKKAESLNRQTLALKEEVLGIEHPAMLMSMNNLAAALNKQGKYEEGESMNRQTLMLREKVLGLNHSDTLTTMSDLAFVLGRQGKLEEAELMNRLTLMRYGKLVGPKHPYTLTSMNNLAIVLDRQGKFKEAELMSRQTLVLKEIVLGSEHPSTLTTRSNLALVLDSQAQYEEAESINKRTLKLREGVLGPEHPDTLMSINNLAVVLGSHGKYEEAEAMHRQTLAQREKVLGSQHPDTLMSINNLALMLGSQGKYEEAESMHRPTLALRERVLGPEHPDTLATMNNLAAMLDSQGEYEEAESMHRQTLVLREKVLGPEHPDTLTSVYCLAHLLANRQCYDESKLLYERACAGYSKVLGNDHPTTCSCRQQYGKLRAVGVLSTSVSPSEHPKHSVQTSAVKESKLSRMLAKTGISKVLVSRKQ